jgi:hypothetical protein
MHILDKPVWPSIVTGLTGVVAALAIKIF